jgi:hypothetical protein
MSFQKSRTHLKSIWTNKRAISMRFIQGLSHETTKLLHKVYKESKYHQVRQRAQCILRSYQGYMINEVSHIFQVDRVTIYNWLNAWESRHFAG